MHATLLLLFACSNPAPPPADPWRSEIEARVRDGGRAFVADGDVFVARTGGMRGRFDVGGAWLSGGGEAFGVRTAGWGRAGALEVVSPNAPGLGACVPGREDLAGACVRRLEYADAGLTEWWAAVDDGFEQGWTVEVAPAGEGKLVLDVALDGVEVSVGEGEAWLHGAGGESWIVSGLVAWDADGAPLPARLDPTPGGLRVSVDDTGARYPVEIDPVYTTAVTTLTGASAGYLGIAVDGAGDVDGDGYDDVIVGESGVNRAYVFHGSASGLSTTATTTLAPGSGAPYFGWAVAGAGDVDGDGYDDVIVGSWYADYGAGNAFVFHGSPTGVSSVATTTLSGVASGDRLGESVDGAGDVNGDGYDDVIVGAPYAGSTDKGTIYVFHGSATGVSATATTSVNGPASNSLLGEAVSGAGDVNGDGYDDVVVGAHGYSSSTGRVYVLYGSASGISSSGATTLTGTVSSGQFGYAVAGAGDVNADGYDEVVVGAPYCATRKGCAYVYYGSAAGVTSTAAVSMTGTEGMGYYGYSVAGAGDVDGDGYADLVVGAKGNGSTAAGWAYVYRGSASGLSTTAGATLTGDSGGDTFGYSVGGAGDVDADGISDVIVGAALADAYDGYARLYRGYAADDDGDGYDLTEDCDDGDATISPAATEVCDDAEVDEDCDGLSNDDDASRTGGSTWHGDADGDGYGGTRFTTSACEAPAGYVDNADDCDDLDAAISPGATEVCDAGDTDEDCDGAADDADAGATGKSTFYQDGDGDGYGGATAGAYCDLPTGYVATSTDCDDTSGAINPGATEVCDASDTDEDCDGAADDADAGATGRSTYYRDADGDGYGGATTGAYCDMPAGYVTDTTDCDDTNAATNPAATEVCDAANTDEDCDGAAGRGRFRDGPVHLPRGCRRRRVRR